MCREKRGQDSTSTACWSSNRKPRKQYILFCLNEAIIFHLGKLKKLFELPFTFALHTSDSCVARVQKTAHLQWFKCLTFHFQFAINFCLSQFVDCSASVSTSVIGTGFADLQGADTLVAEHSVPWVIHYSNFVFQPGYFGLW